MKRKVPYAIRPCSFHKKAGFRSKEEFIEAIYEAFIRFPSNAINFTPEEWKEKVKNH